MATSSIRRGGIATLAAAIAALTLFGIHRH
jgi:hypothetical protein